jgi:cell wall-associated NlpC family hydrolase
MLTHATKIERTLLALFVVGLAMAGCSSTPQTRTANDHGSGSKGGSSEVRDQSAESASEVALSQVGVPYRYGGSSRSGFDCSGLVYYAYAQVGKQVPRTTGELWRSARPISEGELLEGDVLFFSIKGKMSHVGLYLGDGQFVHAPSSAKRVSVARLDSGYYRQAFIRGGRL